MLSQPKLLDELWIKFSCPTAIRSNLMDDTPVAPLGLGGIGLPMCYIPIAPLGLCRSGKSEKIPCTGIRGNFIAMHITRNLGYPITFTCQSKYLVFPNHQNSSGWRSHPLVCGRKSRLLFCLKHIVSMLKLSCPSWERFSPNTR